jgi:hypothetical protein
VLPIDINVQYCQIILYVYYVIDCVRVGIVTGLTGLVYRHAFDFIIFSREKYFKL